MCAGANAPPLSLQMKTVLAALSGRLVPWVNLKAKCGGESVDADVSLGVQVQNAPLLSLQMKTVLAALSGRLVPWVNLKAKVWWRICGCRWEPKGRCKCTTAEFADERVLAALSG